MVTANADDQSSLTNVMEVATREGMAGQRVTGSTVSGPPIDVFLPLLLRAW